MKLLNSILFFISIIFFCTCQKSDEFMGPDLNDLYGPFYIEESLMSNMEDADFSGAGNVYFTARFSRIIDWKLTLTGLNSGAQKVIQGKSKQLDASNTEWKGTISTFPIFETEQVAATLSFIGAPDTLRDTLRIVATRIPSGTMLTSFESGTSLFVKDNGGGGSISYLTTPLHAPYGSSYLSFSSGVAQSGSYKSSLNISAGSISMGATVFNFPNDTNQVYINLIVYGSGSAYNGTKLAVSFWEDDNNNGSFTYGDSEDIYEYVIPVNWIGWKVISFPYKNVIPATYAGRNGNHVKEPHKISSIVLVHNGPESAPSKVEVDYLVMTQGGVFMP